MQRKIYKMRDPVKKYMQIAIEEAKKNLKSLYGGPFGAVIIKNGKVLAKARNTVLKDNNPTAHAEINAIAKACKKLKTFDLSGCVLYSTTEPCPMCFSACFWARIDTICYGTEIADVKKLGFNELAISNKAMKSLSKAKVKIFSKCMHKQCLDLLNQWDSLKSKRTY